ncbi:MAG: DUF6489 family protein [Panacagrimonas sp.]
MQIKIEIDVKPEELRRFLGLPDVAGLQDDVVQFLREKVGQVNENFNPADFVRGNFDLLRQSPAWKKLITRISPSADDGEAEAPAAKPTRKRSARKPKSE